MEEEVEDADEHCRDLLYRTATVEELRQIRDRMGKEARKMEGNRIGLIMDSYPAMLAGRQAAIDATLSIKQLSESLISLKKSIDKHIQSN